MTHAEFKARFLPYYQKLYRIAYRYVGNACDAEDMVQSTYLKLWEKQDFLEHVESDEAYAVTTVEAPVPRQVEGSARPDRRRIGTGWREFAGTATRPGTRAERRDEDSAAHHLRVARTATAGCTAEAFRREEHRRNRTRNRPEQRQHTGVALAGPKND